jgi:hypothetical protein
LHDDVGEVLPYLNTELGGFSYVKHQPVMTLKTLNKKAMADYLSRFNFE